MFGAVASIALLLSLTMCNTDYCNENMFIVGTMRAFIDGDQTDVQLATVDENGTPISFVTMTSRSYSNFSLNPLSDTSRFWIMTLDSVPDCIRKIAIVHTDTLEFVNAECGFRTLSRIDTVLIEDAIEGDSVAILNKFVDENYDNGNIEIHLAGIE